MDGMGNTYLERIRYCVLVWVIANLFPRALSHHKWYKEKFSDYPKNRKAIIPGII